MKRIIVILMFLFFMLGCVGLQHRGGHVSRQGSKHKRRVHTISYNYRYYPNCEIYYDLGRQLYFYFEMGHWRMAVDLPGYGCIKRNHYGDYVNFNMNISEPYHQHHKVKKQHPRGRGYYKKKNPNHPKYRR